MFRPRETMFESIDRRKFMQLCAGSLALAASGCGRSKDRAYPRGSTVIVGVPGVGALNPTPWVDDPLWLAFLPLVALNDKGEWEGRLAERWEHSSDYREWTYYLRPGVRWHDGVPVTAHDVKFSLELLTNPGADELSPGSIESIAVLNDYTVWVRHRDVMEYQWEEIQYPKHLLERLDPKQFSDWEFWTRPVGNGPYRYVRHVPKTMMEFEANPDYYGGKPKIERVVLKFVGEAGLADLLAGNVDAISRVNHLWIPSLAADARFHVHYSEYSHYYAAIYWQHRHPLFRDSRVRRALTLAINRRELLQVLNLPKDAPLTDGPLSSRQLPRGELAEPLPHDPAQAGELLEAAGWHDRNGDGVREREGLAFRFTALVSSYPPFPNTAVYVQEQLRRVGVDMAVQMQEGVTERIRRGDFQAAFAGVVTGGLFNLMGVTPTNVIGTNGFGYQNARVVKLMHRARVAADPDVKDLIYSELREIFREEVPVTYLEPFMTASVGHRRIRGLRSPFRTDVLRCMEDLWLEEER